MAGPPNNLGFESAGAGAGMAANWTVLAKAQSRLVCGFKQTEPQLLGPFPAPNDASLFILTNCTVDTNVTTAPDGTATADRVKDNGAAGVHWINSGATQTLPKGTYTLGAFFKKDAGGSLGPRVDFGGGLVFSCAPDLSLGSPQQQIEWVSPLSAFISAVSGEMVSVGNGWFIVSMTFTTTALAANVALGFARFSNPIGGVDSYAGTTQGDFIWGEFAYDGELADVEAFENSWAASFFSNITLAVNGLGAAWGNGTVTTGSFDGFEGGWGNLPFLLSVSGVASTWNTTASSADAFEREWSSNESFMLAISGGMAMTVVDTGAVEAFEDGWANDAYVTTVSGSPVTFNNDAFGPIAEEFESPANTVIPDHDYTVDPATDVFTAAGHGLPNGTLVVLANVGGAFPAPLTHTLFYYVISTAANTFQLSLTVGGAAINVTDAGTGEQIVRGSPSLYWNGPNINPTI